MDIISTGLPHLLKAPQNQKVCSKLLRTPQKDMIFGKSSSNLLKFTFTCSKVIFDMSFVPFASEKDFKRSVLMKMRNMKA